MAAVEPVVRMERRIPRAVYLAVLMVILCRMLEGGGAAEDGVLVICHGTGEVKGVRAMLSADRVGGVRDGREDAT